jgi:hypothetical protein
MPKIRTVKPSFFMSRAVKKLSDEQKLVWLGLWPNADDEGRMLDEPEIIAGQLWALSKSAVKLDRILEALDDADRIIRYEIAGERFIQVTGWHEHQRITRVAASVIPGVPDTVVASRRQRRSSVAAVPQQCGKGKEGKGEEGEATFVAEPPLFCSLHEGNPSGGACSRCGDARRVHERWMRSQRPVEQPTRSGIVTPAVCTDGYPLGECPYCDQAVAS